MNSEKKCNQDLDVDEEFADWSTVERKRRREIERDFYFLKVHLGDSNRQPQSSRENLE